MFPIFTICFIIFLLIWNYKIRKSNSQQQNLEDSFWEREREANLARRKDISNLDYIILPENLLPANPETPTEMEFASLQGQKMLNLTGLSNTDLKMEYGPANLNELSEADSNFTSLVRCVNQLGNRFNELGDTDNAIKILEYGIECNTDISNTYYLLAQLYIDTNQADKIQNLVAKAASLNSLSKNSIIKNLNEFIIF